MALNNLGLGINLIVRGNAQQGFQKLGASFGKFSGMLPPGIARFSGLIAKFGPLVLGIGLAVVAFKKLINVITGGIDAISEWEQGFTEVTTLVSGIAEQHLPALEKEIGNISVAYGKGAQDMLKASYQAISAGVNIQETGKFMRVAGKLAIGGVTDMETAVDGLTSIKNAFGFALDDMTDVSDKMFVAMKFGKTTIAELSRAIGKVAPISATLGISLKETLAMTAALTKGGLTTSEAVTGIRQAMVAVMRQTPKFTKAAKKYGIETDLNIIKQKGFTWWIEETNKKLVEGGGKWSDMVRSVQGMTAILTLAGKGMKDNQEILAAMDKSAGASEEAFGKMSKTYQFALGQMDAQKNQFMKAVGLIWLPIAKSWVKMKTWIFRQLEIFTVWFKANFVDVIWETIQPFVRLLGMIFGTALKVIMAEFRLLGKVIAFIFRMAGVPLRVLGRMLNILLDGVVKVATMLRDQFIMAVTTIKIFFIRTFDSISQYVIPIILKILGVMEPILSLAEKTGLLAKGTTETVVRKVTEIGVESARRRVLPGRLSLKDEIKQGLKEANEERDAAREAAGKDKVTVNVENQVHIGPDKIFEDNKRWETQFLVRNFVPIR